MYYQPMDRGGSKGDVREIAKTDIARQALALKTATYDISAT